MRIGHGFDVHEFERGRALWLCGVKVPHYAGLKAHSDGDVAIHALCDALLGAAALGDIGRHFPDHDPDNKDRPSHEFLSAVAVMITNKSYSISNVDLTIIAQQPKLAPFVEAMRGVLAGLLHLDIDQINIKATTTENLGFEGREEGISAHAVVLLV